MRFWERFLKIIYKLFASEWLKKAQAKSIEAVLKSSIELLDKELLAEIKNYIMQKQTKQGGFSDKAGKCDIYYSLFGYYVSEALDLPETRQPLKAFVNESVKQPLNGVNLYCASILYAKLFEMDANYRSLRKQVVRNLSEVTNQHSEYTSFLGILALYYLGDYLSVKKILNQYKSFQWSNSLPCPVTAATTILLNIKGKNENSAPKRLMSFYRGKGDFAALKNAPASDLLSTATALYALRFIDSDLRLIKPDCLIYVDSLYDNGGFRSMILDPETDVEYTFYGLLALGALNN
jgi:prenyltransferase beta subunit